MNETPPPHFSKTHRVWYVLKNVTAVRERQGQRSGLQHPAGSQLCPASGWCPMADEHWSQNWNSRKLALQGGTNWIWVWWTSNAFLSCWHLKLARPWAWRQLEPWWNPLLMDTHSPQNARGLGTGTPGCFMISLLWGRTPSWGSAGSPWHPLNSSSTDTVAPMAMDRQISPLFGMAELWAQDLFHLECHFPPPLNSKAL